DVVDHTGNKIATIPPLVFSTPKLVATGVPITVSAVHPGAACALTGADTSGPGRCVGGLSGDDIYHPFTLPANEPIEVAFTQPLIQSSATLGMTCGTGSVRVEELDPAGGCTRAVPGTLLRRDHTLAFVPDVPWTKGTAYRLVLGSNATASCSAT